MGRAGSGAALLCRRSAGVAAHRRGMEVAEQERRRRPPPQAGTGPVAGAGRPQCSAARGMPLPLLPSRAGTPPGAGAPRADRGASTGLGLEGQPQVFSVTRPLGSPALLNRYTRRKHTSRRATPCLLLLDSSSLSPAPGSWRECAGGAGLLPRGFMLLSPGGACGSAQPSRDGRTGDGSETLGSSGHRWRRPCRVVIPDSTL